MSNYYASAHRIDAKTAAMLAHNFHECPKLIDAAFDKIRDAAENGLYGISIDFDFIDGSAINMNEVQGTLRQNIIQEIRGAGFKVESGYYGTSNPSVYVSWVPKEKI